MSASNNKLSKSAIFPTVVTILGISLAIGSYAIGSDRLTILFVAVSSSVSLGAVTWLALKSKSVDTETVLPLELPFAIAHDREIFDHYLAIAESLKRISQIPDPVFREASIQKIKNVEETLQQVATGRLRFESTETWRLTYEALLRSPSVYLYRSVAWIQNKNYWQDEPGRKSTQLNFELANSQRLSIERIAIIADDLWPGGQKLPNASILDWIEEHRKHGIWIKLIRQSALASDSELLVDMGIYGSHAVGEQILDNHGRTIEYVLRFDFSAVEEAEQRWNRLSLYATSYRDLLEKS